MKLNRKIKSRSSGIKVEIEVKVETDPSYYCADEVRAKRRTLVEGIYDLLRDRLNFEIEEISLK